jgi:glycosyltransferase involved in cell wall biosynthesis
MTPMEALAHGVPLVLLDAEVSREVYAAGAAYVSLEPAAIGDALTRLLTDDRAHAALREAGRARLSHFSWPHSAGVVRRALEEAAARS